MSKITAKRLQIYFEELHKKCSGQCPIGVADELMTQYDILINPHQKHEYNNGFMLDLGPEINVHNVHHFMVAPASRRMKPDFGLGASPDSGYELTRLVSPKATQKEEGLVSCLDFIRAIQNGYRLNKVWYDNAYPEHYQKLFEMGLITIEGKIITKAVRQGKKTDLLKTTQAA